MIKDYFQKRENIVFWGLFLISFLFVQYFYFDVFWSPNSYLFGGNGDGLKNYFTFLTQVRDPSLIHSSAMNYPYGEHFMYLDCHPALTVLLKPFFLIPGFSNYAVGTLNFLMLTSIIISPLIIYKIFRKLNVDLYLAAFSALTIVILSPQIYRMLSHFALSYTLFIPLSILWLIQFYQSEKKLKWGIILSLNVLFWLFTHAYMGLMIIAFYGLFFLFYWGIQLLNWSFFKKHFLGVFFHTIFPLIFIFSFMSLTDNHVGRTTDRYGYKTLEYASNWGSVFAAHDGPLKEWYHNNFDIAQNWEGWSYVGTATTLILFIAALYLLGRLVLFKVYPDLKLSESSQIILASFLASIPIVLFAMGYPFRSGYMKLFEMFEALKNFRSMGRFAWIFYFVSTISCIYFIHYLYKKHQLKWLYPLLFLVPLSYAIEGWIYHQTVSHDITQNKNEFSESYMNSDVLAFSQESYENFQCVLPLPFYHVGSEAVAMGLSEKSLRLSMQLSVATGLPLMSSHLSSTSIPESKKIIQTLSPTFYEKPIQSDFKSEQDILILYTLEDLNEYEKNLLERATLIYKTHSLALYKITYEAFFKNTSKQELTLFNKNKSNYIQNKNYYTSCDSVSAIYQFTFDTIKNDTTRNGEGALSGHYKFYNNVFELPPDSFKINTPYVASFWIYSNGRNFGQNTLDGQTFVQVSDSQKKDVEWISVRGLGSSPVIHGDWTLIEVPFQIKDKSKTVSMYIKGSDITESTFIIDDVLVRPANCDVYQIDSTQNGTINRIRKNNHWVYQR